MPSGVFKNEVPRTTLFKACLSQVDRCCLPGLYYLACVAVGGTAVGAALILLPPISLSHLANAFTRLSAFSGSTILVFIAISSYSGRPNSAIVSWLAWGAILRS